VGPEPRWWLASHLVELLAVPRRQEAHYRERISPRKGLFQNPVQADNNPSPQALSLKQPPIGVHKTNSTHSLSDKKGGSSRLTL
ncbi:hypothetical protein, partial [Ferrimonas marina]|uniref:hypothetical protein n=1 Tax=Ferrimonas marina TaxID=299255 RepID=UPI001F322129